MTYTTYLEIGCFQSISETYYSIYLVDTSGTNIAVYRKAEQSSTLRPAFTADKAVDGDENTNMNSALLSKTCTHRGGVPILRKSEIDLFSWRKSEI